MKLLVTGHRRFKLENYDTDWIKLAIEEQVKEMADIGYCYGLSGMASGVDLWFCESCLELGIPYAACVPFDEQQDEVEEDEKELRLYLIDRAAEIHKIRNSVMVNMADAGLVIWDGNKGGTHNVVQQMVEKEKPFVWLNPVSRKVWGCI